ncbi:MAG TPA: amidohydrolase family protein [Acidimicrobiia bacterium]|nr:amidohydrolase family protein [Acidimicrobiia bacterium]
MTASSSVVLSDVRVIRVDEPGMPLTDPVDLAIEDGRIASISAHRRGAGVDGAGRYVLPGLVNAHDHLYSKELRSPAPGMDIAAMRRMIDTRDETETVAVMLRNAWRAMAQGVLVIRDLGARHGANTRLASLIDRGIVPGPTVIPAGRPIVMTGGHVWTFGREADGADECRKAVREQRKAGAKVIKVMASGGLSNFPHEDYTVCEFTDEELAAITDEARKLGLPTCAHAFGTDAIEAAVRAGIDSVEHGVHLDDATVEMMVERGIGYVPTIANMHRIASPALNVSAGVPERAERFDREIVKPQMESVARAIEAGVRIGIGTDSTGTYREEIAFLMEAGMDCERIVRAATVDGAVICRSDAGVVAEGRPALLTLYESNPSEDPTSLDEPSAVFDGRRLFERRDLEVLTGGPA